MNLYYLGAFPPGYGGVTIKNQNLYDALSEKVEIGKIDFNLVKRKNIYELLRMVFVMFNRKSRMVIGVSGKSTRKRLTQILYYLNRQAMRNSILILMGGTASNDIASDADYRKCAGCYKMIYAETESMVETLKKAGLKNSAIYPNGRFRPKVVSDEKQECKNGTEDKKESVQNKHLRCIFFSEVSIEKGVNMLLAAAEMLPDIKFEIWGHILPAYETEFFGKVEKIDNVSYKGVFTGNSEAVYKKLREYDVMLFPTQYDIEGVPGVLVETKIAGITAIVSDKSYNAEIIHDGIDGLVLGENTDEALKTAILRLNEDRNYLQKLKYGSYTSAENYYIENYVDKIINALTHVGGGKVTYIRRLSLKEMYPLRCVFFSQISKEKGANLVLDVAKKFRNVTFDFYGTVVPDYEDDFYRTVNELRNVTYLGIFRKTGEELYEEISKYDVMLFPTKWPHEGVPGVLVESKIAGITTIVSDICFNAELVLNGVEGIVLKENNAETLSEAIKMLDLDRELLNRLKQGSYRSAEKYYIENYVDKIVTCINR